MARRFLIWFWSATGGGGSQFTVNLAHRLSLRFGDKAVTVSLHADDPSAARAEKLGLNVRTANVSTARLKPFATIAGLAQAARTLSDHAKDSDCVLAPMNFAAAAPLSLTLAKPLVYFAHDPSPHPGDYARNWQRATQAVLMQRSSRVVALSRYGEKALSLRSGLARKLVCTPLSAVFEPSQSYPQPKQGPLRLLCAGRMIAYKGVDLLADALAFIRARDDWRLTVAGHGPALTPILRSQLDAPHVTLQEGWMSEAALQALIAECDVFIAPYRSATQSGVVAQALASGKPCIVTPIGALPEQIAEGRAGWIADAAEPRALGAVLNAVLNDEAARAVRANAAARLADDAWHADYWRWLEAL